jgi:hypothetical protein
LVVKLKILGSDKVARHKALGSKKIDKIMKKIGLTKIIHSKK